MWLERAGAGRAAARGDAPIPDRAVIATRGGYGSAQLLPYLDLAEIRSARTLLIGYSDITALLDMCTGHAGIISVHGPMAEGRLARGADAYDRDSFLRIVCEPRAFGTVAAPGAAVACSAATRSGRAARRHADADWPRSLGTPWAFATAEPTILFLDEVNERPYRLDRLLWQLSAAGVLDRVTGVVFNELPGLRRTGGQRDGDRRRPPRSATVSPDRSSTGVPSGHTAARDDHAALRRAGHADGAATRFALDRRSGGRVTRN